MTPDELRRRFYNLDGHTSVWGVGAVLMYYVNRNPILHPLVDVLTAVYHRSSTTARPAVFNVWLQEAPTEIEAFMAICELMDKEDMTHDRTHSAPP